MEKSDTPDQNGAVSYDEVISYWKSIGKDGWFKQDDEFRVPRGATYINFRSPVIGQSASQTAAAVLYTSLLKDKVNEFGYPALLAGLSFDIYKHAQGVSLRISGYDDKQAELLEELLAVVVSPEFDDGRTLRQPIWSDQ